MDLDAEVLNLDVASGGEVLVDGSEDLRGLGEAAEDHAEVDKVEFGVRGEGPGAVLGVNVALKGAVGGDGSDGGGDAVDVYAGDAGSWVLFCWKQVGS